jgi:GT2 family glycosyltransferase
MGSIHTNLVARLLHWQSSMPPGTVSFYFSDHVSPVDRARNQIVQTFLNTPAHFTHLFFIDSDTIPPHDALERLLSHDLPFVSGLTPIAKYDDEKHTWFTIDNCFVEPERDENGKATETHVPARNTGLHKIFRCGASCMLIKREVFEALTPPYYLFDYNDEHTIHTRSEDIRFCDNAIAAGFEIYAETDVVCQHYKPVMM